MTDDHWLMVDGRPARVLLVENDGECDFLDYARPSGALHFIRLGGRSGLGSPRLSDMRQCGGCAQPLDSRDCGLSRDITLGGLCLLCRAVGIPTRAAREQEKFGMTLREWP